MIILLLAIALGCSDPVAAPLVPPPLPAPAPAPIQPPKVPPPEPNACGCADLEACEDGRCRPAAVTRLSSGTDGTCALLETGRVACWGARDLDRMMAQMWDRMPRAPGQPEPPFHTADLGPHRPPMVSVVPGVTHAIGLSMGSQRCALREDGTILCWEGSTHSDAYAMVGGAPAGQATALDDAVSFTFGDSFGCAVRETSTVACWGGNGWATLGNGTQSELGALGDVIGVADAVEVEAATTDACARLRNGSVRCWGRNSRGQAGDGSRTVRATPVAVRGLNDATDIALGISFACALRRSGGVSCWGYNESGQLGRGSRSPAAPIGPVARINDAEAISAGQTGACALRRNGEVWCWGGGGLWGFRDGGDVATPRRIEGLGPATQVSVGAAHACAIGRDGLVRCWGWNNSGQLGQGTDTPSATPLVVPGIGGGPSL